MIIQIASDGSTIHNPGEGGWAAIFRYQQHCKAIFGFDNQTTNNRMELTAAIKALEHLRRPCEVELSTDSQYVVNGITDWIRKWKKRNWASLKFNEISKKWAADKPVINQDLWKRLDLINGKHNVNWIWVKGHLNHEDNLLCDVIAREAARKKIEGIRVISSTVSYSKSISFKKNCDEIRRAISFNDD
jgi:ribonuclease HI